MEGGQRTKDLPTQSSDPQNLGSIHGVVNTKIARVCCCPGWLGFAEQSWFAGSKTSPKPHLC
jgi:hypothetical protein